MIWRIAWKNFLRQGVRAFLNVLVTALSMIAIVFMLSLINGFQAQATRNMVRTDIAGGQYRAPGFDILTPTEWEDNTFAVSPALEALPSGDKAEVMVLQGQLYPNRRLYPVQLRGMEMDQTLLRLPLKSLEPFGEIPMDFVPVVVGAKMSERAHLKKGDALVLKWRDKYGVVDARDVKIVNVVEMVNARVDQGVVWLRLDHLRTLTGRPGEASWVAVKNSQGPLETLEFHSPDSLMEDLLSLLKQDRMNSRIFWGILMILICVSVFNTQMLNVFKRQREIGTLMALGLSPGRIVGLFTLEGAWAAFGAVVAGAAMGIPFFAWFQGVGMDLSHLSETTMPVEDKIFLDIHPPEVLFSVSLVVVIMVFVAWLPVRKILKVDPTLALRGRAIT